MKDKEGRGSYKVADLQEFWRGQPNIELMDPNLLACKDREELLVQLIESRASVEFNQGLDIRLMSDDIIDLMNRIKLDKPHFAWDRYQDKEKVVPKFERVAEKLRYSTRRISVYVLCNYDTTFEQDMERVMILRSMGYSPYVMLYDKEHIPKGHELRRFARWVNNRIIFWATNDFSEYERKQNE